MANLSSRYRLERKALQLAQLLLSLVMMLSLHNIEKQVFYSIEALRSRIS